LPLETASDADIAGSAYAVVSRVCEASAAAAMAAAAAAAEIVIAAAL
jgi:hypothetical protein